MENVNGAGLYQRELPIEEQRSLLYAKTEAWAKDHPFEAEYLIPDPPKRATVLGEAQAIVYGDREKTYGRPSKNLDCIANLWNAYLDAIGGRELTNKDVAAMMILLKTARLANDPTHRDSIVDICGYAALIERCDE